MWNDRLDRLAEFPFRRLASLLAPLEPAPGREVIDLVVGEPQHAPPAILAQTVAANGHLWNRYPPPNGTPEFREAVRAWLCRRYDLPHKALDPDRHILPVAGTKEALFLLPQVLVPERPRGEKALICIPNPVYAVYVGAVVMNGAEPVYLDGTAETGFLPDLDALSPDILARMAAFYLCTPSNPQGSAADLDYLRRLVRLARAHDFILVVDECYCEIHHGDPPPGGLEAAFAESGGFENVVVMHSLSKRSSAAGLRSGFVAGDDRVIQRFLRLRAYAGATQPMPLMAAATALWQDETHVRENLARYRSKFEIARRRIGNRFGFAQPDGGFFLWLDVGDGEEATRRLWSEAAVRVLPGAYLAVPHDNGYNPAHNYVRLALVHDEDRIDQALDRLVAVLG